LRTRLRLAGVALVVVAILMAAHAPLPDVLVSANADAVAVRGPNGRLSVLRTGSDALAARDWLSANGDARQPNDATLKDGFRCDDAACIAQLADGGLVSVARTAHGLAEDCRHADLVVTWREAPPRCRALTVDRNILREGGRAGDAARGPEVENRACHSPWNRAAMGART
jgi:competence protein ComEC